ncbi:MAG TPA: CHRD domain-containing protein [Nitrososphaeraceae archaeon]|nr:CHRD domain-containing protein [Nitrososphaeraceae archaeon]
MNNLNKQKIAIFAVVVAGLAGIPYLYSSSLATNIAVAGIYSASLSGDGEIPKVNTQANGQATFESNAQAAALGDSAAAASSSSEMSYEINVHNIDRVTAAHIHMGRSDENGPIVVTLFKPKMPTGEITGELVSGRLSAQSLEGPLQGRQISDLVDLFDRGEAYVNLHTVDDPNGEIRGTIQQ